MKISRYDTLIYFIRMDMLLDVYAWVCYGSGKDSSGDIQMERIRENVL